MRYYLIPTGKAVITKTKYSMAQKFEPFYTVDMNVKAVQPP
jgi:hypothetical protein